MARCMLLAQRCPHLRECGEVFMCIARLNRDVCGRAQQLAPICRDDCASLLCDRLCVVDGWLSSGIICGQHSRRVFSSVSMNTRSGANCVSVR